MPLGWPTPVLEHGATRIRPIRVRDARALEAELVGNRTWLQRWEATNPDGRGWLDARGSIRGLLAAARLGTGLPYVIEVDGEMVGQLNVSGIAYGSLSSASIGYWIAQRSAGRGVTPTAVALATDYCFASLGLHRIEICIRPENQPSLRVVEKLGFRYEGLRRRFIHIDGQWRDHFCFALVAEEVPEGVLRRWLSGLAPEDAAAVPDGDRRAAASPLTMP